MQAELTPETDVFYVFKSDRWGDRVSRVEDTYIRHDSGGKVTVHSKDPRFRGRASIYPEYDRCWWFSHGPVIHKVEAPVNLEAHILIDLAE